MNETTNKVTLNGGGCSKSTNEVAAVDGDDVWLPESPQQWSQKPHMIERGRLKVQ
jgi:hypothetical protein